MCVSNVAASCACLSLGLKTGFLGQWLSTQPFLAYHSKIVFDISKEFVELLLL